MRQPISLALDQPTQASIDIFDLHGREVRTLLVPMEVSAGWTFLTWKGEKDRRQKVPSGVDFFRLKVPFQTLQAKAVLLKENVAMKLRTPRRPG